MFPQPHRQRDTAMAQPDESYIGLIIIASLGCLAIWLAALWQRKRPAGARKLKLWTQSHFSRFFSLLNPSISVYWLWFVIVFGAIAVIPWYRGYGGERRIIAAVYDHSLDNENAEQILVIHTALATALSSLIAIVHAMRLSVRGRPEAATFSLRALFIVTAVIALICGCLRWLSAPPGVFIAVLLPLGGHITTKILAGAISRRITPDDQ
jgi:hypothetical protein